MSLLAQAKAQSTKVGNDPVLAVKTRAATPKLRSEVLDLLEAAVSREVTYSAAARVLTAALAVKVSDEMVRKHAAAILEEHGR